VYVALYVQGKGVKAEVLCFVCKTAIGEACKPHFVTALMESGYSPERVNFKTTP
jgi:hypothetical protein